MDEHAQQAHTDMDSSKPSRLLAVDLGVRCGLAVFGADGRLLSYRSTNFGSVARMKNAVWGSCAGSTA